MIPEPPVGADLSCPAPIYRPLYASTEAASPCHPEPQRRVCLDGQRDASPEFTLSEANVLSMTEFLCPPERSEGSVALGSEMLRCTQHDSAVTHTASWIHLLNFIIGPRGNLPHPLINLLN